jgi:hypothetical protein
MFSHYSRSNGDWEPRIVTLVHAAANTFGKRLSVSIPPPFLAKPTALGCDIAHKAVAADMEQPFRSPSYLEYCGLLCKESRMRGMVDQQ